jgi:hypothetical protein
VAGRGHGASTRPQLATNWLTELGSEAPRNASPGPPRRPRCNGPSQPHGSRGRAIWRR